ncbi:MAG: cytochrome c3 family protein, partial [Phycisphaerales bacterium]
AGCEPTKTAKSPQPQPGGGDKQHVTQSDGSKEREGPLLLEDEPLLLEDEPLLLDDEGQDEGDEGADNSRCHVCHINYVEEMIAFRHANAGIGCAGCHGESDEHIADESWASGGNGTAPDAMFPKKKIDAFCMGCHTKEKLLGDQHEDIRAGTSGKVCTDCHGNHRLQVRRCKWK